MGVGVGVGGCGMLSVSEKISFHIGIAAGTCVYQLI